MLYLRTRDRHGPDCHQRPAFHVRTGHRVVAAGAACGAGRKNVTGSRRALALASDPGKFLSTVQIGITLIGVLSGAFSGATLGQRLTNLLVEAGWSQGVADAIGVGVVVTVITYASLIIGELVPKQIALRDPEAVAVRVAPYMTLLAKISSPAVWLLDRSGKALLWLLGQRGEAGEKVSEDEIRTLVVEAENAGVLEPGEKEMIAGVMRLGDLPVGAVMTPRREVSMINLSDALKRSVGAGRQQPFPLRGVRPGCRCRARDRQRQGHAGRYLSGQTPDIRKLVRQAPIIPEFLDARDVVAILRDSAVHMGLVHDEYGVFQGVVTSADILESIVGGFHTEEGPPEAAAVKRDDGSYLISGWMPAVEFASLLRSRCRRPVTIRPLPASCSAISAGYPTSAISIEVDGWRFEVLDLDGRRIDKVLAAKIGEYALARPGDAQADELKLAVEAAGEDVDRAAVGVVGGVGDQLIVGGKGEVLVDRVGVVGLEDPFVAVVETAVADQQAEAAGRQEIAVRAGKPVDGAADADCVARTSPIAALDRQACRDAAVDVGKGQDLVPAVVPARAGEQADILHELLLGVDVESVFEILALDVRHDVVDIERRVCGADRQRVAVVAGIAAIGEDAQPQFAGLVEHGVTFFEFDNGAAGLEGEDIAVRRAGT